MIFNSSVLPWFALRGLASLLFPYQTLHSPQQHGPWLFSQSREASSLQRAWVSERWPCLNTNTSSYSPTNTSHRENTIMSHAARPAWQDRIWLQRDLVIWYQILWWLPMRPSPMTPTVLPDKPYPHSQRGFHELQPPLTETKKRSMSAVWLHWGR